MTKSSETVLYGVRGYKENIGSAIHPEKWAELRTFSSRINSHNVQAYGKMATPEGTIMWFSDPGARDEFHDMFGGVKVTLSRKIEVVTGSAAEKLMKGFKT